MPHQSSAKLRPPRPPPALVARPRLVVMIADPPAPVTLIAGPAGSGKTVLLGQWYSEAVEAGEAVAWLNLDERDSHPAALWGLLLEALRRADILPSTGTTAQLRATSTVDSGFIDELVAGIRRTGPTPWLVLDDLHRVADPCGLRSLDVLLERAQDDLRVILSSRRDPPLSLNRRRLDGSLREVRMEHLAFRPSETNTLLRESGLETDPWLVARLTERTEGWAASLRIAAIALASEPDHEAFVRRFDGDDHAVADYLVAELLAEDADGRRDFLLRTSVCSTLPIGLAAELSGRSDAATVLEGLVHENLLTSRTGRDRATYRYHDVLRTYLVAELRRTDPAVVHELHLIASRWYLDRDDHLHALDHLTDGPPWDSLTGFLREHGLELLLEGHGPALLRAATALPDEAQRIPTVAWLAAAAALELSDLQAADRWIATATDPSPAAGVDDPWIACLASIVDLQRHVSDDLRRHDNLAVALDTSFTGLGPDLEQLGRFSLGQALLWEERPEEAIQQLTAAADQAEAYGRNALLLACHSHLAAAGLLTGDLEAVRAHAELGSDLATRHGWTRSRSATTSHALLAWHAYLQVDGAASFTYANQAVRSLTGKVEPTLELFTRTCFHLAAIDAGADVYDQLHECRAEYTRLAPAVPRPLLHGMIGPILARHALAIGERSWARQLRDTTDQFSGHRTGEAILIATWLDRSNGRPDVAFANLQRSLSDPAIWQTAHTRVMALLELADIHHSHGAVTKAHAALVDALELADPQLLLRPFLLASPQVIAHLIRQPSRFGRLEPLARRIAALHDNPVGTPTLVPLTPTELELLRELPTLLTVAEIAVARTVSVNTVKTHLRAIYRKLGVPSRRKAVEAARLHGLL